MSMRYKGGVISATPPTTSTSSAPGIWTLEQQMQAQGASAWPIPPSYFIDLQQQGGSSFTTTYTAADSSSNIYVASGLGPIGYIGKFDSTGVAQWQKTIGTVLYAQGITVDSSSNVYATFRDTSGAYEETVLVKFDSAGTTQWQRKISWSGSAWTAQFYGLVTDSSGNVYLAGTTNTGGAYYTVIAKFNSSGTIQWQRRVSGQQGQGKAIAIDSSSNLYICGNDGSTGSVSAEASIIKYNSSGTIQWANRFGGNSSEPYSSGYGITIDSSANVYVALQEYSAGVYSQNIVKYNSSGTYQSKFGRTPSSGYLYTRTVSVATDGSLYVVGRTNSVGAPNGFVCSYNSSGTLQWQRYLGTGSSGYSEGNSGALVNGGLAVGGFTDALDPATTYQLMFAVVPLDGTKTGNYTVGSGTIKYQSTSFSSYASSGASNSATASDAAGSMTVSTPTYTISTVTPSQYKTAM